MKFLYPHKLFAFGFVLYSMFFGVGFYSLFMVKKMHIIFPMTYTLLCLIPSIWYYVWYKIYKEENIVVTPQTITVSKNELEVIYKIEDITSVTLMSRMGFVRNQQVIRFETVTGEEFFISDDIASFKKLENYLKELFKDMFVVDKESTNKKMYFGHDIN